MPWAWLERAARLPGKALHVAIVLWLLAGLKRARTVALASKYLVKCEVGRHSAYRALLALERAGLVAVVRGRGRQPLVTLLDVSPRRPGDARGGLSEASQ